MIQLRLKSIISILIDFKITPTKYDSLLFMQLLSNFSSHRVVDPYIAFIRLSNLVHVNLLNDNRKTSRWISFFHDKD